jgi:hypothetical protein
MFCYKYTSEQDCMNSCLLLQILTFVFRKLKSQWLNTFDSYLNPSLQYKSIDSCSKVASAYLYISKKVIQYSEQGFIVTKAHKSVCKWFIWADCYVWCTDKNFPSLTRSLTHGAEPFLRNCKLCSHSRNSQHFIELEGSLPCSQEPSTGPYPEPDRSNPHHPILSL